MMDNFGILAFSKDTFLSFAQPIIAQPIIAQPIIKKYSRMSKKGDAFYLTRKIRRRRRKRRKLRRRHSES
jgi:hypothetical protein